MSASLLYEVMVKTLQRREHAALLLHRAAQDATAFLNLGEPQKASDALQVATLEFQIACDQYKEATDNYYLMQMSKKENENVRTTEAA
jgi:hypothetical protein